MLSFILALFAGATLPLAFAPFNMYVFAFISPAILFYVVQGLMILYLTRYLHYTDQKGYLILGEFSTLLYIAPIIGGWIADRFLGYRYAVLWGAFFLFLGYALISTLQENFLLWGMAIAIVGSGFLKPNISSFLGDFYHKDDPRREAGFTIFYMGINIGSFLATLSSGYIQQIFGWGMSFAAAACGLLIALLTFYKGFRAFQQKGLPPGKFVHPIYLAIATVVFVFFAFLLLHFARAGEILQTTLGIGLLIFLLLNAFRFNKKERNRFVLLVILMLVSILYWSLFFQMFFSVNLFVDRAVDKHIFGHTLPTPVFLAIEPLFILILGPFLANLWERLSQKKINPFVGNKFALSLVFAGLCMLTLAGSVFITKNNFLVYPLWMVLAYFFLTVSEMLLSPIGLAAVTELSPNHWKGFVMGIWFMTLGFGGSLAGYLAQLANIPRFTSQLYINGIFAQAFFKFALISFVAAILLFIFNPWLKKLI